MEETSSNDSTSIKGTEKGMRSSTFDTGVILSLIGASISILLLFWTIIFLIFGIINIVWLNKIKKGATDKIVASSVISIIFGGIFGIIGGIMMLIEKP